MLGRWLAGALGLPGVISFDVGGSQFPIVWSILGSALFVAFLGFLQKKRKSGSSKG